MFEEANIAVTRLFAICLCIVGAAGVVVADDDRVMVQQAVELILKMHPNTIPRQLDDNARSRGFEDYRAMLKDEDAAFELLGLTGQWTRAPLWDRISKDPGSRARWMLHHVRFRESFSLDTVLRQQHEERLKRDAVRAAAEEATRSRKAEVEARRQTALEREASRERAAAKLRERHARMVHAFESGASANDFLKAEGMYGLWCGAERARTTGPTVPFYVHISENGIQSWADYMTSGFIRTTFRFTQAGRQVLIEPEDGAWIRVPGETAPLLDLIIMEDAPLVLGVRLHSAFELVRAGIPVAPCPDVDLEATLRDGPLELQASWSNLPYENYRGDPRLVQPLGRLTVRVAHPIYDFESRTYRMLHAGPFPDPEFLDARGIFVRWREALYPGKPVLASGCQYFPDADAAVSAFPEALAPALRQWVSAHPFHVYTPPSVTPDRDDVPTAFGRRWDFDFFLEADLDSDVTGLPEARKCTLAFVRKYPGGRPAGVPIYQ